MSRVIRLRSTKYRDSRTSLPESEPPLPSSGEDSHHTYWQSRVLKEGCSGTVWVAKPAAKAGYIGCCNLWLQVCLGLWNNCRNSQEESKMIHGAGKGGRKRLTVPSLAEGLGMPPGKDRILHAGGSTLWELDHKALYVFAFECVPQNQ